MASFSGCWGQLKAKGYKHANGKEVLTDNDKQSILDRTETFKKEDGLSHDDAIRKSIQEHHDEAHAQVQSIHEQVFGKQEPVAQTPAAGTGKVTPDRQQLVQRGMHGAVKVAFPDAWHKELFAFAGRVKRAAAGDKRYDIKALQDQLAAKLGIPKGTVGAVSGDYRRQISADIKSLKEGDTHIAPNFKGEATSVPESPVSTTAKTSQEIPTGIQKESGKVETPPTEPPAVTEVAPISDEQHVSTIANRFTEERTKSGELGEIAPGQGYSTRELADAGLKMTPEQINQHVSDLMNGTGDPIEQGKAVRAEEARLSQRSNELSRAASADPTNIEARTAADNAFKDLTDFHNGPVARAKQIFHGLGMSMQGELPVDLSTFNGLREKFLRDTGKPPTPEQEPQLREMAEKVTKSVSEDNGAKQNLGQAIDKATARRKLPTYDEVRQNIADRMKIEPCRS